MRPYLKKIHHKKGLMEWLKVKALSSNPRTAKKKRAGGAEKKSRKDQDLGGFEKQQGLLS
jgi:ribosomal protein S21